jgi:Beta-lactamase
MLNIFIQNATPPRGHGVTSMFRHLGALGLFFLAILDSSPLPTFGGPDILRQFSLPAIAIRGTSMRQLPQQDRCSEHTSRSESHEKPDRLTCIVSSDIGSWMSFLVFFTNGHRRYCRSLRRLLTRSGFRCDNCDYGKCGQVCSDSGTSAIICDSEGRDVDLNWHRFHHTSLFILIFLLTAPRLLADTVDDYIREQMHARHVPGLVLLVLRDSKVIKQQSYGLANIESGVPTSKDSVFPLASVTKIFTATAVYLPVQEGKLRLSDKVTQLLPGLPYAWNEITVLNCLSHTSDLTG